MSFFKSGLSDKSIELDASRLRVLLSSLALPPAVVSQSQNVIQLIPSGIGAVQTYPKTTAGLTSALSSASSGDAVYVPPCTLAGDFTVPAGVGLLAQGEQTIIQGTITLGSGSYIHMLTIDLSESNASDISGVVGPSSGTAIISSCNISADNTGAGGAYGINGGAGQIHLWNSKVQATRSGLNALAVGVQANTGAIYIDGGWVSGDDAPLGENGSVAYSAGPELSSGAITVTASAGVTVSGLVVGTLYAIEAYNGPWDRGAAYDPEYTFDVSNDGGSTWPPTAYNGLGRDFNGEMNLEGVSWGKYTEVISTDYARMYFYATTTSIKVRVADGTAPDFADNTGSLSYRLLSATFSAGTPNVFTSGVRMDPLYGEPTKGDRGAWDVESYAARHASDISEGLYLHHLPTPTDSSGDAGKVAALNSGGTAYELQAQTDSNAIHNNVSGEINAITEKTTPVNADLVIIEDSESSNVKKKVQLGNLPGGGSSLNSGARAYHNTSQSIGNNSTTYLSFNAEDFDTDSYHDPSTNNSRLTIPVNGIYIIIADIRWANNNNGSRDVKLVLNRTTTIAGVTIGSVSSNGGYVEQQVCGIFQVAASDYIEVSVYQNSGGSLNVTYDSAKSPYFMIARVG